MVNITRKALTPGEWTCISMGDTDVLISLGPVTRSHARIAIAGPAIEPDHADFITLWERTDPMMLQGLEQGQCVHAYCDAPTTLELLTGTDEDDASTT